MNLGIPFKEATSWMVFLVHYISHSLPIAARKRHPRQKRVPSKNFRPPFGRDRSNATLRGAPGLQRLGAAGAALRPAGRLCGGGAAGGAGGAGASEGRAPEGPMGSSASCLWSLTFLGGGPGFWACFDEKPKEDRVHVGRSSKKRHPLIIVGFFEFPVVCCFFSAFSAPQKVAFVAPFCASHLYGSFQTLQGFGSSNSTGKGPKCI